MRQCYFGAIFLSLTLFPLCPRGGAGSGRQTGPRG